MTVELYGYSCSNCKSVTYVEWEAQRESTLPECADCNSDGVKMTHVLTGELTVTKEEVL